MAQSKRSPTKRTVKVYNYSYDIRTVDGKGTLTTKVGTFACTCSNKQAVMTNVKESILRRKKYTSKKRIRVDVYKSNTLDLVGTLDMRKGGNY